MGLPRRPEHERGIGVPAQGQCHQLDPRNPALGSLFQQTDRLGAERESHRVHKRLDFG